MSGGAGPGAEPPDGAQLNIARPGWPRGSRSSPPSWAGRWLTRRIAVTAPPPPAGWMPRGWRIRRGCCWSWITPSAGR
jgi:hypothetical protein